MQREKERQGERSKERKRERKIFYPLAHCPNSLNGQDWVKMESEPGTTVWSRKRPKHLTIFHLFPRYISWELGQKWNSWN